MKAIINGVEQEYKPRLDSEKPKSIPLKTAGECLSALKNYGDDEEIRDAATRKLWMMLKEQHEETRYWAHRKANFEPTAAQKKEDEIFQTLFVDDEKNDSISRLMERRRDVWGLDDSAQYDDVPEEKELLSDLPDDFDTPHDDEEGELSRIGHLSAEYLEDFVMRIYDKIGELRESTSALEREMWSMRVEIENEIGFF